MPNIRLNRNNECKGTTILVKYQILHLKIWPDHKNRVPTVKDYLTVQKEGKRMVKRRVTLPARQLANHILYPRPTQGVPKV